MNKQLILARLNSMPDEVKSRIYVIKDKPYTFGEIVAEIENDTEFGKKLMKAMEKVLR